MNEIEVALVTGATGFIGQVLCHKLREQEVRVVALARRAVEGPWASQLTVDLGAERLAAASLEGIDTVFHLAGKTHAIAESRPDEEEYQRVNTEGTAKLLRAALAAGVRRFVFVSTVKAMGNEPQGCQDETSALPPDSPYGRSKLAAEGLVLDAGRRGEVHAVVLRLPLVYGPGVKGNLAVMMEAVANERFPPLEVMDNKRSMIHVDDVARGAIAVALAEQAGGQIYILTDGEPYSTSTLYELMRTALGKTPASWHLPLWVLKLAARFGDLYGAILGRRFTLDSAAVSRLTESAWYSSRKIEHQLGFYPTIRLHESLTEMLGRESR